MKHVITFFVMIILLATNIYAQNSLVQSEFEKNCDGTIVQEDGMLRCVQEAITVQNFWKGFTILGWTVAVGILFLIYEIYFKKD